MSAKILKNQISPPSGLEVHETGKYIPASGQITIDPINYVRWATPETLVELSPYINSGDIVVNDGTTDLSPAEGIEYLKYPDFTGSIRSTVPSASKGAFGTAVAGTSISSQQLTEQAAKVVRVTSADQKYGFLNSKVQAGSNITIETINPGADEKLKISATATLSGKAIDFEYSSTGIANNKWLNVGHPSVNSNDVPWVAPSDGKAVTASFSNKKDSSEIDLEFYVNAILVYTWDIRNKRTAYISVNAGMFTISKGDRISVFAKDASGTSPRDINGEVVFIADALTDSEGGQENGD